VADHPLRERLRSLLMLALYRLGQTAESLAVFEDGRRLLADELGADPGGELEGTAPAHPAAGSVPVDAAADRPGGKYSDAT
jgi:DNA-binding SARP family transcriptional activator